MKIHLFLLRSGTLQKLHPDFADFYEELYDEVKVRGDRGIAAVPKE